MREEMDRAPTAEEIEEAIGLMKQGKAAGESEVTAELLEAGGKWVVGVLEEICREVWEGGGDLAAWRDAQLARDKLAGCGG